MPSEDRLHRNQPDRQGPIRSAQILAAGVHNPNQGNAQNSREQQTVDEVVAQAVREAYQVVEENIHQGRNAAELFREGKYGTTAISNDAKAIAGRLVSLTRELSTTWFDLIAAVLRDPKLAAAFAGPASSPLQQAPQPVSPVAPFPLRYRVSSRKPTEVTFTYTGPIDGSVSPAVLGLHSLKQDLPTIHGVEFVRESSGNYVRVNIEEDQPAGTYVGTVVDRESEKPIGTLHVRVLE